MFVLSRRILITCAIPYSNGPLHLGHLRSTYIPGDIYARYCRLRGYNVTFVCGTDDHGAPIELKAIAQKVTPDELTDYWNARDKADFDNAGVSFDIFGSTKTPEHKELVYLFYERLKKGGFFESRKVKHAYCPNDKRFLPDRYVKGTCPKCGALDQYGDSCEVCGRAYSITELIKPRCSLCGTTPEARESEHLFFKLSSFAPFLTSYLSSTPTLPSDVVAYVKNWVSSGLQDWDITRDAPYYGIEIPDKPGKFFYVWHDAFLGYLSTLAVLEKKRGGRWDDWWGPESDAEIVHFIGKDVVYHHYLFWPSMLKGAGFKLPTRIPTRGYLNLEAEKMSKSRGTLIQAKDFLEKYPADFLRYYLTAITPNNVSDGDFSWREFRAKVNNEYLNAYGNYAYRVLSFIQTRFNGVIPEAKGFEEEDLRFQSKLEAFASTLEPSFETLDFKAAQEAWLAFAISCNQYFSEREPWNLGRHKRGDVETVLHLAAKAVYALSLAALTFTPHAAERVLEQLNLKGAKRVWGDYSAFKGGMKLNKLEVIYPKLPEELGAPEHPKETGKKVV